MLKKLLLCGAVAVMLLAQVAAPPRSKAAATLNAPALEAYVRHLLVWPAAVQVKIGDPSPSLLPGFYRVVIRGTLGGSSQEETFYVSADTKTIVRGDVLDMKKNPFQDELDVLKTDQQPHLGSPFAPVSVVEFADFQCPYCRQEASVVRTQLMQAFPGEVQLIYMDYPLASIHPFARAAAILGRCVYTQSNDSFWAYHDWIFQHQAEITPDNLSAKALDWAKTDKNLDGAKLAACAMAPEPRAQVDRTVAMGEQLHINATPTFFVNGRRMVGTVSLDNLKMVAEQEIAWAKAQSQSDCCSVTLSMPGAPAAGTAPAAGK